jgi:hypothetical protein
VLWKGETYFLWLHKGKSGWTIARDLGQRASRPQTAPKCNPIFY